MSEIQPKAVTREEFNRQLTQALDDLVADAKYHGELIQASFAKPAKLLVVRETPPSYGGIPERLHGVEKRLDAVEERLDRVEQRLDRFEARMDRTEARLDRIERTLNQILERMATKVELEAINENVKKMADGYMTIGRRLDAVADLLKLRVVAP